MKQVMPLAAVLALAVMCGPVAGAAEKNASGPETAVTINTKDQAPAGPGAADMNAADAGKAGTATLLATVSKPVSLIITPAKPSVPWGTTLQFIAVGKFQDKTTRDLTSLVEWKSSNIMVATINTDGLATAGARGGTTIVTASFQGKRVSAKLAVVVPVLTSIVITPEKPTVRNDTKQQFSAVGKFSDKTVQDLTSLAKWRSSDTTVAAINAAGLAFARAKRGATTITASFQGKRGSARLIVSPRTLVKITVTPDAPWIPKGATQQFTAMGVFSDKTAEDLTSLAKWKSSDKKVATINTAGIATARVTKGTATITASFKGKRGSRVLTVSPALVSLTVTPANASVEQMTTQQFIATGTFTDGSSRDLTSAATWTTRTPYVAFISAPGLVNSWGAGTSIISASCGGKSGSTELTVRPREVHRPFKGQAPEEDENGEGLVKWPAPRFVRSDGAMPGAGSAVEDRLTGLMWAADANTPGPVVCGPAVTKTWQGALDYMACLNTSSYLGYRDWRLPNRTELFSLADFQQSVPADWLLTRGFTNMQSFYGYDYWLSDAAPAYKNIGCLGDMSYGVVYYCDMGLDLYVWPVRAGK
jgi:hypothetical protein